MKKKGKNNQPFFSVIEHTADIGIRVRGRTKKTLFVHAAKAMFLLIAQPLGAHRLVREKQRSFAIQVTANNSEELLVAWLSELLALSDIHKIIFIRFVLSVLTDTELIARAIAEPRPPNQYELKTEIKAVTYHQLNITRKQGEFQAEVIFDV